MSANVNLAPLAKLQFNQNGVPLSGGLLFTYAAGTMNKQATYTDSTGVTPNTNPIILDANGQCDCWLQAGLAYKLILSPPTDTDPPTNPYWTEDNIYGASDLSTATKSYIQSGALNYGVDTGTSANAYVVSLTPAIPATIPDGFPVKLFTTRLNSGASTLNGAPILLQYDGGFVPLVGNELFGQVELQWSTAQAAWILGKTARQSGYLPAGVSAVPRSVADKLNDMPSITDFMTTAQKVAYYLRTGLVDMTAAIQAALTASKYLIVPAGVALLSATLVAQPGAYLKGLAPEQCVWQRSTAYGDTLQVGTQANHAGGCTVEGIWFNHVYAFNNGSTYVAGTSTNITNKDPTANHLLITQGQNVRISKCWFIGLGYGIHYIDSTVLWVDGCLFHGMWDANVAGLQDTTAGIFCDISVTTNRCALLDVGRCQINGYAAAAATNVTTGNVTVSHTLNAGMQYGILINSCESVDIHDNYIGGQSVNSIKISATGIVNQVRIHDNQMDGASNYSIWLESQSASYFPSFVTIHHNTGVGYGNDQGFVKIHDTGQSYSAAYVDISNNTCQYYLRAGIEVEKGKGVLVSNNRIAVCNSDNAYSTSLTDATIQSACYFDANSTECRADGNYWGGSINAPGGASNLGWGSYFAAAATNSAANNLADLNALGGTVTGGISQTYPTT